MKVNDIGTMLSEIPFVNFPIILKNAGFDYFIIDTEHGAFDYSVLSQLVMNSKLINMTVIIRLSDNSRRDITRFMDMGVTGLLLPMTNTSNDIAEVVKYAKYSPLGKRGISTTRMHTLYNPPNLQDYMKTSNNTTKIYAQIETKQGVENLYDILNTIGVDGVFIGPNDLSCDLGCIGDEQPILEYIKQVAENAGKLNKEWGIITTYKEYIEFSKKHGVSMICYGSELNMLINSCGNIMKDFKL